MPASQAASASLGPVWAVVVAAGSGTRFGRPKQFEELRGRRVLDWSLAAASAVCEGVVLVVPSELVAAEAGAAADIVVAGGATRSGSVRAGLAAVPANAGVVVVHDAARPLASPALFASVIQAVVGGAAAAVPGVAVPDTLRGLDGSTVDRSQLVAVQTPQAFRADALRAAHAALGEATDDASLVEAAGGSVVIVVGEGRNRKITEPDDLVAAQALLEAEAR